MFVIYQINQNEMFISKVEMAHTFWQVTRFLYLSVGALINVEVL
jgi:hypothetical protein